jgi:hypothetical protein
MEKSEAIRILLGIIAFGTLVASLIYQENTGTENQLNKRKEPADSNSSKRMS